MERSCSSDLNLCKQFLEIKCVYSDQCVSISKKHDFSYKYSNIDDLNSVFD